MLLHKINSLTFFKNMVVHYHDLPKLWAATDNFLIQNPNIFLPEPGIESRIQDARPVPYIEYMEPKEAWRIEHRERVIYLFIRLTTINTFKYKNQT